MKVWEMEKTDVVRLVLRRSEWETLITALAGAAAWAPVDRRSVTWEALDVLRNAEEDIDASRMVKALDDIAKRTEGRQDNDGIIINGMAERGRGNAQQKAA